LDISPDELELECHAWMRHAKTGAVRDAQPEAAVRPRRGGTAVADESMHPGERRLLDL